MNTSSVTTILLIKALIIGAFIVLGTIGLSPDEAQYWTWSRHLDWGYYSKPPGISWAIWPGTAIFGHTELGVRFGAIFLGLILPCSVLLLGYLATKSYKIGLTAALLMALTPLGILASILAITDTGMSVFWVLALCPVTYALANDKEPNYILSGCFIALAALFKWPAYVFWFIILAMYPFHRKIRSNTIFLGIALSLAGIIPSIYWNYSHDWASFKHVLATILGQQIQHGDTVGSSRGNFFEFLGAQAALLSPIIFVMMVLAVVTSFRKKQPVVMQFLATNCFSIITLLLFLSLFKKIQGNWGSYAYPAGLVWLSWYAMEYWKSGFKWLQAGIATSIILVIAVLSIPYAQSMGIPIPYKFNPFRHNVGWDRLDNILKKAGYDPDHNFLFSDKYQTVSILSFYSPMQHRAYFLNLQGTRKNQFSYWPSMANEQVGKTGYFVAYENNRKSDEWIQNYKSQLKHYFAQVEYIGSFSLFEVEGKPQKFAYVFRGVEYNGKEPLKLDLY